MAANSFVWYELMTTEPAAALEFYTRVFGWTELPPATPNRPHPRFGIGETPVAGVVPACADMTESGVSQEWVGYIQVESVADFMATWEASGGAILRQPETVEGFGIYGVAADPHGAIVNFIESPSTISTEGVEPNSYGHVCWRELRTPDTTSAMAHYGKVFGWTPNGEHDLGRLGIYRMFGQGQAATGAMMPVWSPEVPAHWFYYFFTDRMNATLARVREAGGEVDGEPEPIPGDSWIARCKDPQGAGFALVAMSL